MLSAIVLTGTSRANIAYVIHRKYINFLFCTEIRFCLHLIAFFYIKQGGHALRKTGKMVKKKSLQGKIREFEILLKIREKSGNFKKSYLCKVKIFKFYIAGPRSLVDKRVDS